MNTVDWRGLAATCGKFRLDAVDYKGDPGFTVDFEPDDKCDCAKNRIRLVQAVKVETPLGILGGGHGSRFDVNYPFVEEGSGSLVETHKKTPGGIAFPAQRDNIPNLLHRGKYGYLDAPDYSGNDAKWLFEVCAVCNHPTRGRDDVLGCFRFDSEYVLATKKTTITVFGGAKVAPAGTATQSWSAGCGSPTDKICFLDVWSG